MRKISRQHAVFWHVPHKLPHRGAARLVSDRRSRRSSPQARLAPRRKDRAADPVAAMTKVTARLPLPLGYSLGFGGL
jgi:hypothetical protein